MGRNQTQTQRISQREWQRWHTCGSGGCSGWLSAGGVRGWRSPSGAPPLAAASVPPRAPAADMWSWMHSAIVWITLWHACHRSVASSKISIKAYMTLSWGGEP